MGWTTFYKGPRQTTKQWFEQSLTHELRDWMSQPEGTAFNDCPLVGHSECLKSAVFLRHGYAAVRTTYLPDTGHPKAGTSEVWCAVYLFEHYNSKSPHMRRYGHDFGYKDMDESVGPNVADCPAAVLDLLTPLPEPTLAAPEMERLRKEVDALGEQLHALAAADAPAEQRQELYAKLTATQSAWYAGDPHRYARQWRQDCRDILADKAKVPKVSKGCLVRFDKPLSFSGYELQELRWTGKGSLFGHPRATDLWPQYRVRDWRKRAFTVVKEAA